ncbi:hypothetical protein EVAR_79155_1 [Eumeta japonica]|uniref:Uncharacterized protein n=1 Tax=Eumeta variegata TaxID=151549 RepID=A0A4C1UUE6_EUMVA|nr:hypothetical protein EVAR_79155_1 [Eumeta japonica]
MHKVRGCKSRERPASAAQNFIYIRGVSSEQDAIRHQAVETAKMNQSSSFDCSFEPRSVVSGSARVRVCGVPRSVSRAAAVKPRASVPARSSGYPAVCTPSPHTVSAPRVVLVIFASSRGNTFTRTLLLRRGNPEGFLTFAPLAPCAFWPLR